MILEHQTKYSGKRVKRGLFRTSNGLLINADCNATANIGKKVFPVIFDPIYGTVDVVSHPVRLELMAT